MADYRVCSSCGVPAYEGDKLCRSCGAVLPVEDTAVILEAQDAQSSEGNAGNQSYQAYDSTNQAPCNANQAYDNANQAYDNANQAYDNANQAYDNANQAYDNSNQAYCNANQAYGNANQAPGNANQAYGNANQANGDANQAPCNANQAYDNANQAYGNANQAYGNANQAYGNANQAYGNNYQGYNNPNNTYGNPNQAYGNYGKKSNEPYPTPITPFIDKRNNGYNILGWIFPLYGIIFGCVRKEKQPVMAKSLITVSVISIVLNYITIPVVSIGVLIPSLGFGAVKLADEAIEAYSIYEEQDATHQYEQNTRESEQTSRNTSTTAKEEEVTIENAVIVDNDEVYMEFTEYTVYVDGSAELVCQIKNKTEEDLFFVFSDVSVDGVMCDPNWSVDVVAGEAKLGVVRWNVNELNDNGINYIQTVKGMLNVLNVASDNVYEGSFDITVNDSSVSGPACEEVHVYDFDEKLLVETNGVKLVLKDTVSDVKRTGFFVYVENNTDYKINASSISISVNGVEFEQEDNKTLSPHTSAYFYIAWDTGALLDKGIVSIESADINLSVYGGDGNTVKELYSGRITLSAG